MAAPTHPTVEKLTFQPPHPLNDNEKAFIVSLSPKHKELHELATQMLGSSHFEGKTHDYTKWKNSQTNQDKPPQATK